MQHTKTVLVNTYTGCAERSHLFSQSIVRVLRRETLKGKQFEGKQFARPFKHIAFGTLVAQTPNALKGQIMWRSHIAPIIKLQDDQFYILDPALSADPIAKNKWYDMLVTNPNAYKVNSQMTGFVTCWPNTYTADNECFDPSVSFRHTETVNERISILLTT